MKEAAGEANMTVITIVLIAIVLAVGTLIVNSLLTRTARSAACNSVGGKITAFGKCHAILNGVETDWAINKCSNNSNEYYIGGDSSNCG